MAFLHLVLSDDLTAIDPQHARPCMCTCTCTYMRTIQPQGTNTKTRPQRHTHKNTPTKTQPQRHSYGDGELDTDSHLVLSVLLVQVSRVPLLPEELAGAEEGLGVLELPALERQRNTHTVTQEVEKKIGRESE